MSFQTPITIAQAIKEIDENKYLLPAIQREFVWHSTKIEWLFDSLMQNFPISSFLFWEVEKNTAQQYKFYKFINEYRERYKTHNQEISTNGINRSFYAILDGQQRLTSLYLGLKGSFAYKEYRKKWEDTECSIPTRQLYLNISHDLVDEEDGRKYEFKFLSNEETKNLKLYTNDKVIWFKVGEILNFIDEQDFDDFIEDFDTIFARKSIRQLRRTILEKPFINYFLEKEQSIDKALNIFIRINSGGEPLSFSDLIMSIAVASWNGRDARKEIHRLVDNIRDKGFNISKDLVLKTFLYLYSRDIKFKVKNFSKDNAVLFEEKWDDIRDCILSTFDLIKTFGFNDFTLTSKNALLPIMYWLYHKNCYQDFSQKIEYQDERTVIKRWLNISLIKQIFSGNSDTILSKIRRTFTENINEAAITEDFSSFPNEEIFLSLGKEASVGDDFIESLLSLQYEDAQTFSLLSLLYPNLDYKNNNFHKDHLHPRNQFDKLPHGLREIYKWREYNSIVNLQMLGANENMSKNDSELESWIEKELQHINKRLFLDEHIIPADINDFSIEKFDDFYKKRKSLLFSKISKLVK